MPKISSIIHEAFPEKHLIDLTNRALQRDNENAILLDALATYHLAQKRKWEAAVSTGNGDDPTSKKRKLDNGTNGAQHLTVTHNTSTAGAWSDPKASNVLSFPGISFSMPQRKKLTLQVIPGRSGGLRAEGANSSIEFGVGWADVEQLFCLPVPEKAKPQYNFVVIPRGAEGYAAAPVAGAQEPIVWTEADAPELEKTRELLKEQLKAVGKGLTVPDAKEFVSEVVQSHKKGEKAYHVKAFKGSKEGYLFFLPNGILFAFKKPLLFFPFHAIASISYTSVLQRTFNLVITSQSSDGNSEGQELEFSMLDQVDFGGIDEYVKRHELNDASLASSRKAQRFGVNDPKAKGGKGEGEANGAGAGKGEGVEDDDETELQKAERMLQDEEDDDEEDYDPGSEGESEGSGSSDEEEDEGEGEGEGDGEDEGEDEAEEEEGEEEEEEDGAAQVEHTHEEDPDEPEGGYI